MLIPSANVVLDFLLNKNKKKLSNHQVPLINSKNGQGELTTPEIKNPNFELIPKFPRISSSA